MSGLADIPLDNLAEILGHTERFVLAVVVRRAGGRLEIPAEEFERPGPQLRMAPGEGGALVLEAVERTRKGRA
jgi:hypothetical protein